MHALARVPDVQIAVVRAGEDVFVLAVVLDLGRASEPVAEAHDGPARSAQVPAVYKRVDTACGKHVRLVRAEIYVGDCACVRVEDELYGFAGRKCEVPHDGFLVRRRDDPVRVGGVRRPLNVGDGPGC